MLWQAFRACPPTHTWHTLSKMASDTSLEASAVQRDIFRRMSPAERLRLALEMSESMRNVALAGLCSRRPDLDGDELRRELLRTLYGFRAPS